MSRFWVGKLLFATVTPQERLPPMTMEKGSFAHSWWTVGRGDSRLVATAIHDGHDLRGEVAASMALSGADRLREEYPFTGQSVAGIDNNIVVPRSRSEFYLNRGVDGAIYSTPDQSWGLSVRDRTPEQALFDMSRKVQAAYYRMLGQYLDQCAAGLSRVDRRCQP